MNTHLFRLNFDLQLCFTFTRFSWYYITANIAQRSQRGKRKGERSTDYGMAWNGFECKWLECGNTNCKMWMSMMVPDEVDMEYEAFKCGMCIVKEMNVMKGEKDLLRKEVDELRKEIVELKKE